MESAGMAMDTAFDETGDEAAQRKRQARIGLYVLTIACSLLSAQHHRATKNYSKL